jgi:hypothetical protein
VNYRNPLLLLLCSLLLALASPASRIHAQQSSTRVRPLKFANDPSALPRPFRRSRPDDPYLVKLREEYRLDDVILNAKSDYEKVRLVSKWVRSRWEHNGQNMPEKSDPISILQEAEQGKRFRCVEYSAVLAGALNAIGIPARVLSILTEDVETRESGAAHVVAEAYVSDQGKWIMVDGQWDVIPVVKGKPIGAVELQRALAEGKKGLSVETFSGVEAKGYFEWISPYLFYFITKFDSRYGVATDRKELVLVPVGAKEPKVVQKKWPIGDVLYTRSLSAFNAKPL